jgi:DNA-binding FadR family transcriptional regulator
MADLSTTIGEERADNSTFWSVWHAVDSRYGLRSLLEAAIDSGRLSLGQQLPTERDIAVRSGLSRATVRGVMQELKRSGRIVREVGRGTFVAGGYDRAPEERVSLSPADIIEMRLIIEPSMASLVVYNATDDDLSRLARQVDEGHRAKEWQDAERCDATFHDLFYRSAHNEGLDQIANMIRNARRNENWLRLKQSTFSIDRWKVYQEEHLCILERLVARDAVKARQHIVDHLSNVQRKFL